MEILDSRPEVQETEKTTQLNVKKGAIEYRDVHFSYPRRQQPLFENLSVKITPGETVALVGPSGS